MTTTTVLKQNIYNIKLVINISVSSSDFSRVILDLLLPFIKTLPEKARLRVYPYFIYDNSKGGSKRHLSQKDASCLRILTPSIAQLHTDAKTYITTYNITPTEIRKTPVLRSIVNLCESLDRKRDILLNRPAVDSTGFTQILDLVIYEAEASSTCIIVPAFDPKIMNHKQIPKDLFTSTNFSTILTNIDLNSPILAKPSTTTESSKQKNKIKPTPDDTSPKKENNASENRIAQIESLKD